MCANPDPTPGRAACSLPCKSWRSSSASGRLSLQWIGSSLRRSPSSTTKPAARARKSGPPWVASGRCADSAPHQPTGSSRPGCHQRQPGAAGEGGGHCPVRRRKLLLAGRQRLQRPAWFPTRATLHAHLRDLVARLGSSCALLRWHAWRQYGAVQVHCLGLPTPGLLRWGGWSTPQMLRVYAYPGPEWSF